MTHDVSNADQEPEFNWERIAYLMMVSRAIDDIEEQELVPQKKVLYQFSARGHDLAQIMIGSKLTHPHDAAGGYYRSRPLLLSLGLSIEDAMAGPLMKSDGFSDGRDIGVVCNLPEADGAVVLPMSGSVGSQYTPIAGWAQAVTYRRDVLGEESWRGAMGCVFGGDGSVATNGFWASLTMATTLKLPMLFYIEDNGYGISVTSDYQTPGGNIAANLASFKNLHIIEGDGTNPAEAAPLIEEAVRHVRGENGPCLLRLNVVRLSGHSGQDTQAYKPQEFVEDERARDPLPRLKAYMLATGYSEEWWSDCEKRAQADMQAALEAALARPEPDPAGVHRHVFSETKADGSPDLQIRGGLAPEGMSFPETTETPQPEGSRINMVKAIRRTLQSELKVNPKLLVFGEDVGPKGGVHAATMGLHAEFGEGRVFDTSLSEEGIIGRSVGMAAAGLMPVPEIQFRKYADPAHEQISDTGTIRWRTNNRFAAPMVIRVPGGFFKCGDPWHSQCHEVVWAHTYGWRVAFPSNAEDAVGLLREAMRANDPTIFFEHRSLLDGAWARRPYPGDDFVVPFGKAKCLQEGFDLTVVTWGAMVERCVAAADRIDAEIEILDLRTISPWDREAVLESVRKTGRCLIVHEDNLTAGFGAEIAAVLAQEAFFDLDAPVSRLTMPDVPSPHNPRLLDAVVPNVDAITDKMIEVIEI
ncbi:MAG: transketolase C-terminal domain-containing protein [Acidobacteriota bacterium]|nr:transketolase C-terminal domain-containing protein [Acidobacteriota bacterium]